MLGYLENLLHALNIASLAEALERVAAVVLCMSIHEMSHGLAAYALGDPTAKSMHRLSLNPLRHIDWLGLAMLFAAGFGWAKPVMVNPNYFKNPKAGMALTALAGPASNLLTAVVALFICKAIYLYSPGGPVWQLVFDFLFYSVALLSVGMGLFNLLPFPPLDGSKVAAGLLPDRIYRQWMRYERLGMIVLFAVALLGLGGGIISRVISAVFRGMVGLIF